MSSLRLALKLSMEGADDPKREIQKPPPSKPIPRSKRPNSEITNEESKNVKKGSTKDDFEGIIYCIISQ